MSPLSTTPTHTAVSAKDEQNARQGLRLRQSGNTARQPRIKMFVLPRTKTNYCHPIISMRRIDSLELSTVTVLTSQFIDRVLLKC
jgi:hypothetical protein